MSLKDWGVGNVGVSKIVVGLKVHIENGEVLQGKCHRRAQDQPLFLFNTETKYELVFTVTSHGNMESLVRKVKSVSVKLWNFDDYLLETTSDTATQNERHLKASAILDSSADKIHRLISFRNDIDDDVKVLDLTVAIEANLQHERAFNIGMKIYYTTSRDVIAGNKKFKRPIGAKWKEGIHQMQDFEHSVLFCGMRMT